MTDIARLTLRAEVSRKALHLLSAAVPLAWAFALVSTPLVRVGLSAALGIALAVEAARRMHAAFGAAFTRVLAPLLRAHEARAITGATWLAAVMCLAAWTLPVRAAVVALWAAAAGDAIAAVVGRTIAARAPADRGGRARKTAAGSLACAASTAMGAVWLVGAGWWPALAIGAAAAVAERPTLAIDDNLRVGLAAGLAAWLLLPA